MSAPQLETAVIYSALRQVIDPELGCNVVDLGLIYDVSIAGARVVVKMTLTTPGCPMHDSIATGVRYTLLNLGGVEEVEVELVWDPPWHPNMMSDAGRAHVGLAQT